MGKTDGRTDGQSVAFCVLPLSVALVAVPVVGWVVCVCVCASPARAQYPKCSPCRRRLVECRSACCCPSPRPPQREPTCPAGTAVHCVGETRRGRCGGTHQHRDDTVLVDHSHVHTLVARQRLRIGPEVPRRRVVAGRVRARTVQCEAIATRRCRTCSGQRPRAPRTRCQVASAQGRSHRRRGRRARGTQRARRLRCVRGCKTRRNSGRRAEARLCARQSPRCCPPAT